VTLVETARRIAKSRPDALLPCPLCASSVKGANLAGHIARTHADQSVPPAAIPSARIVTVPAWRGRRGFLKLPARLALADNALVLRGIFARRSVDLPCEIETGTITDSRPDMIHGEYNTPSVAFDAGTYLRFVGPREIVVACRAKASRLGAARGPKRTTWDIVLVREAFVALQYALVEHGLLAVESGDLAAPAR
jgi:hypothetical protein